MGFSGDFSNSGTATIGGTQCWAAGTHRTNNGGSTTLTSDAGPSGATLSVISNGGVVSFAASQHLAALSAGTGGMAAITPGGAKRATVGSLTLGGTTDAWNWED